MALHFEHSSLPQDSIRLSASLTSEKANVKDHFEREDGSNVLCD